MRSDDFYIKWDNIGKGLTCPRCNQVSRGHAWLFTNPPPRGTPDMRKAAGEAYFHDGQEECIVRVELQ